MKKLLLPIIIAIVAITFTTSCKKKDENNSSSSNEDTNPYDLDPKDESEVAAISPTFEDLDGADVSTKISFDGATKSDGTPPEPTTSGPTLYDYTSGENTRANKGNTINLDISNSSSDIQGVYLQVDGASDYFDIPTSSTSTAKTASLSGKKIKKSIAGKIVKSSQGTESLSLEIPSDLPQGKFCVSYCVYDSQNEVSNIIRRCIEVQELGGDASIQGTWKFKTATFFIDGEVINIVKGKKYQIPASSGADEYELCWANDVQRVDQYDFAIKSDNSYTETYSGYYESYELDENGNCTKDEEYSGEETDIYSGYWAYDKSIGTLTMIEEDEGYYDPYFVEYRVRMEGSKMTLSWIEPDEDFFFSYIINMEKN